MKMKLEEDEGFCLKRPPCRCVQETSVIIIKASRSRLICGPAVILGSEIFGLVFFLFTFLISIIKSVSH